MEIEFVKTSPTQNMTILVETQIPEVEQLAIGQKIMAYESVYAEQTGFIQEPQDKRAVKGLRMMAGEFCGNATMSLAAWVMEQNEVPIGETKTVLLEVSGAEELVLCEMKKELEQRYFGKVAMPMPKAIVWESFELEGTTYQLPVVQFEGISHIIVEREVWGENAREMAEKAVTLWAEKMPDVFGILLWDKEAEQVEPLVCVKNASLVWEEGCGSGTSAIGAFLAMQTGKDLSLQLKQPGGVMGVEVTLKEGKLTSLQISGRVFIVATGKAYI
ncbi:MAG: hypothetical protein ACK5I7_07380 [Anaerotignum sp.]